MTHYECDRCGSKINETEPKDPKLPFHVTVYENDSFLERKSYDFCSQCANDFDDFFSDSPTGHKHAKDPSL